MVYLYGIPRQVIRGNIWLVHDTMQKLNVNWNIKISLLSSWATLEHGDKKQIIPNIAFTFKILVMSQ